jgi:quercetin dioxygenase-like cupin family protein
MGLFRVYAGDDGHSHVQELRPGEHPALSEAIVHGEVSFHEVAPDFYNGFHQQPEPRIVIVIDGRLEFHFGDGGTHRPGPGDATLFEDFTGSGHDFGVAGDAPAVTAVITLQR